LPETALRRRSHRSTTAIWRDQLVGDPNLLDQGTGLSSHRNRFARHAKLIDIESIPLFCNALRRHRSDHDSQHAEEFFASQADLGY
jgi:hypothetical protein